MAVGGGGGGGEGGGSRDGTAETGGVLVRVIMRRC